MAVNPAAGVSLPRVREAEKRFLSHRQVHEPTHAEMTTCLWCFSGPIRAFGGVRWLPARHRGDAMDAAGTAALADAHPLCTTGEVVELRHRPT
jgi:hypothetical protein